MDKYVHPSCRKGSTSEAMALGVPTRNSHDFPAALDKGIKCKFLLPGCIEIKSKTFRNWWFIDVYCPLVPKPSWISFGLVSRFKTEAACRTSSAMSVVSYGDFAEYNRHEWPVKPKKHRNHVVNRLLFPISHR